MCEGKRERQFDCLDGVCLSGCMAFACSFVRVCMLPQYFGCVVCVLREEQQSMCVFENERERERLDSDAKAYLP